MSYGVECVCGGEKAGRICVCPKGMLDSWNRNNPRFVGPGPRFAAPPPDVAQPDNQVPDIRAAIEARQAAAGPGVAINITDLVASRLRLPEGFTFETVSREEAESRFRSGHIDLLCRQSAQGFDFSKTQTDRFRAWLGTQTRLHDGCIEFSFSPCSMGTSVWVENSLTKDKLELTEYDE